MVEGPGATRNARKLQFAIGKTVRLVNIGDLSEIPSKFFDYLLQRQLKEVFSVGKEVFLIFSERHRLKDNNDRMEKDDDDSLDQEAVLRIHFGMSGSLWCRKGNEGDLTYLNQRQSQKQGQQQFTIQVILSQLEPSLTNSILMEARGSTVNFGVTPAAARNKYRRLCTRDCCSDSNIFKPQHVYTAMRVKRQESMICNALLDQDVYPGVGNIIKIEGLHNANVHPQRLVSSLSDEELYCVIHKCKIYAMNWLKSGHSSKQLKNVYNQTLCQSCGIGKVHMMKLGSNRDIKRVTFWCDLCQPLNPTIIAATVEDNRNFNNKRNLDGKLENVTPPPPNKRHQEILAQWRIDAQRKDQIAPPPATRVCPTHGARSTRLKRVRKDDSKNKLRLFRTCTVKTCQYFEWADGHFPTCKCNSNKDVSTNKSIVSCSNSKTVLRISKTQKSGGRWFFCCANNGNGSNNISANSAPKTKSVGSTSLHGCGYFSWASSSQLAPLGQLLTPLL